MKQYAGNPPTLKELIYDKPNCKSELVGFKISKYRVGGSPNAVQNFYFFVFVLVKESLGF